MDTKLLAWGRAAAARRGGPPPLWLFTDSRRLPDPLPSIERLPRGLAGVVFRHDDHPDRPRLGHQIARICRQRRLTLVVAGDTRLAAALHAGLGALGLKLAAQEGRRLPQLTTVAVPPGVDEARVRAELLQQFNIEIAAGLGPLRGKVWRIGLMGESSRRENVTLVLGALEQILAGAGFELSRGKALAVAQAAWATG